MDHLEIAILREKYDEKFIDDYYKWKADYESENSSAIRIPGAWPLFYLGNWIDNSEQEAETARSIEA